LQINEPDRQFLHNQTGYVVSGDYHFDLRQLYLPHQCMRHCCSLENGLMLNLLQIYGVLHV